MRTFSSADSPIPSEPPAANRPALVGNTAVLYCNLGTPDEPTPSAVRRYLAEFLADRRVVEIPRLIWWPILYGIILTTRPKQSAAKYASIWTKDGSPLRIWTAKQALLLSGWLGQRGHRVDVRYAMRYGQPSITEQLDAVVKDGAKRVLILPAYPQYSATSTASVFDQVYLWAQRTRNIPELRFVNSYHDDPGYIHALAASVREHWKQNGRGEKLVMSFHGVPERTRELGDPYHDQCQATAALLAKALGLTENDWKITFQSRLGRAQWLQPYTEPSLIAMAQAGTKRVDVICPGFTSDCLETLEEIAIEAREAFLHAGGKEFHYIPCLNEQPAWIGALRDITANQLAGWSTQSQATQP